MDCPGPLWPLPLCPMKHLICAIGLASLIALSPTKPAAQAHADLLARSEQALANGQPALAVDLTAQLITQNPNDFAALILQSLAQADLGNDAAAFDAATRAYGAGQSDAEWLQAARLAGAARFRMGQYLRAQWWLRRAANHAQTPQDTDTVRAEFQRIRQANPLTAQLGLSIAPSDNINNGSEQNFFTLEGIDFEFTLPPGSLPLSGVEYAGEVKLSYQLSRSATQMTSIDAYFYGRTYTLTRAAQATVPDIVGNDYALALAEVSLNHSRFLFDGLGPTTVSAHLGRVWFSGDPLWDYQKLSVAQAFRVRDADVLTLTAAVQDQQAQSDLQPDTVLYDLSAAYATPLANGDVLELTLAAQLNDAATETDTFTDYSAFADYRFNAPVLGARWGVSFGVGYTNYDEFTLSLDGRRDTYASLGATAVLGEISYFGFSPSISVTARRTVSNVTQFTSSQIEARIGIQSTF